MHLKDYNQSEVNILKEMLIDRGATFVYEAKKQQNTHGLLKKFLKLRNSGDFLRSKYNRSLFDKLH